MIFPIQFVMNWDSTTIEKSNLDTKTVEISRMTSLMWVRWHSQLHLCLAKYSRLGWREHVQDPPLFQRHFCPSSLALFPQISPFEARPTSGQAAEMIRELHSSLCGWRSWLEGNSTGNSVFLIKLTMFLFRFLDGQRMGILQSTGVFVLGFPAISLQLWTQDLLWIFLESTFETSKMLTQRNATSCNTTQSNLCQALRSCFGKLFSTPLEMMIPIHWLMDLFQRGGSITNQKHLVWWYTLASITYLDSPIKHFQ